MRVKAPPSHNARQQRPEALRPPIELNIAANHPLLLSLLVSLAPFHSSATAPPPPFALFAVQPFNLRAGGKRERRGEKGYTQYAHARDCSQRQSAKKRQAVVKGEEANGHSVLIKTRSEQTQKERESAQAEIPEPSRPVSRGRGRQLLSVVTTPRRLPKPKTNTWPETNKTRE